MKVYHITYPLKNMILEPSIIAIGYFDGVHLGHQQVIKRACQLAKKQNLLCGIMTFHPHPKEILGVNDKIDQLTPLESKLKLIEEMYVDFAYVVHFSKEFASISPKVFIDDFLMKLHVKGVVVGFDFTFGMKGQGTTKTLMEYSNGCYIVEVVEALYDNGEKVSSTRIRDMLLSGEIADSKRLLGRNYSFIGQVIHGDKRGRTIGFPTANIQLLEEFLHIKKGVYVVKVLVKEQSYLGVMNIGYSPTFKEDRSAPSYEVHLLDFYEDIYHETVEVELIEFIREEKKFTGIDELKKQILEDIHHAKQIVIDVIR